MFDLTGKVAVVTGASRGIGRAIATGLARQGATVVLTDVLAEAVEQTAREIAANGSRTDAATLDVTSFEGAQTVVETVLDRHGRLDVLVNNAGITRDRPFVRMSREDWDAVLGVNLAGAFTCTRAAIRPMMKQRSGRVISISSVVGQMGNAGQANYAASKAGLIGFSKALAREVASRGVTVNVVAPGLIDTDMTRALPEDVQKDWLSKVPLARFGTTDDVATAACFLASDEASYITGQVLAVNGGMYT